MRYDKYIAKIKNMAKVWSKIKRYRVLILSVLIFVTATVTGLLAARGTIYGETACPAEITYGEELSFEADAFMSKVGYEYRLSSSEEWSKEKPTAAGTYHVRAVAKTAFGGKRYGKTHTVVVKPRGIVVSALETELVYGSAPTLKADTALGDRAVCTEYAYTGIGEEGATVTVTPRVAFVRIYNADGADVTGCYTLTAETKAVSLTARPITVTVTDASKEYDGTPLTYKDLAQDTASGTTYEITSGGLAFQDTIIAQFSAEVTTVSESPVENPAVLTFTSADGKDVTAYYDVTCVAGTLTIEKRKLVIATASQTLTYDGATHYATDYDDYTSEGLLDGHTIVASGGTQITNVGKVRNRFDVEIRNSLGETMTENYDISFTEGVYIEIEKRPITLTSVSESKIYDGTALTAHTLENGLVTDLGHTIAPAFTGSQTNAYTAGNDEIGESENTFTVSIFSGSENVTPNYEVDYRYGVLTVEKYAITVVSEGAEKEYDGTPLQNKSYSVTGGALLTTLGHTIEFEALAWGSQTNAYTADNDEFGASGNTFEIGGIYDVRGNEVTKNYLIGKEEGVLKVTKRPITVAVVSEKKVYDGEALTPSRYTVTAGSLVGSQIIFASYTGSQTNAYTEDNDERGVSASSFAGLTIGTLSSPDAYTKNYQITTEDGTLTVTKRPITVKANSASEVYDGEQHTIGKNAYTVSDLVQGHALSNVYTYGVSGTDVRRDEDGNVTGYPHAFDLQNGDAVVLDGNKGDVTKNYDISYEEGLLTISPRPICVKQTHTLEWIYDGEEHYDDEPYSNADLQTWEYDSVTYKNILDGHTLAATEYTRLTDVQWLNDIPFGTYIGIDNVLSFTITDASGNDVTANYEIDVADYGTLTIKPRPITVLSESLEKVYDGTPLSGAGYTHSGEVEEHTVTALTNGSQTLAYTAGEAWNYGESQNTFDETFGHKGVRITDANGDDVTANYEITAQTGVLRVYKRALFVKSTHRFEWTYDGETHYDTSQYFDEDLEYTRTNSVYEAGAYYNLVNGHFIGVGEYTEIRFVKDGIKDNVCTLYVCDADGNSVNENYAIYIDGYGTLEITPRPIYLKTTHDVTWTYDGKAHYDQTAYDDKYLRSQLALADEVVIATLEADRPSVTYVWDSEENELTFTVKDGQGDYPYENYADNYAIEQPKTYGTLTITPRPIYLKTTHDVTWTYDGKAHYDGDGEGISSVYGNVVSSEYADEVLRIDATYYALVSGDQLRIATLAADRPSVTYVWDSGTENILTFTVKSTSYVGEHDYADNYAIEQPTVYGTLTITPRKITVKTNDCYWTYDGNAHYDGDGIASKDGLYPNDAKYGNENITGGSLAPYSAGEEELLLNMAIADRPSVTVFSDSGKANELEFTVTDGNDYGKNDYGENYEITVDAGGLYIQKRDIAVSSVSYTTTYDGLKHTAKEGITDGGLGYSWQEYTAYEGLLDGHALTATFNEQTNADVYEAILKENIQIKDGANVVTENYNILTDGIGTLTIEKRSIWIKTVYDSSSELTIVYDGKAHTHEGYEYQAKDGDEGLLDGHELSLSFNSRTNVGHTPTIDLSSIAIYANGEDVTGNYELDTTGVLYLNITPRPITITTGSASKVYDGTPLTFAEMTEEEIVEKYGDGAAYVITDDPDDPDDGLAEGQYLLLEYFVSVLNEGESAENPYERITFYDAAGQDVVEESNYNITRIAGMLEILERNGTEINTPDYGEDGEGANIAVATVYTAKAETVYLRVESYGDYTGRGWSSATAYSGALINDAYGMQYLTGLTVEKNLVETAQMTIEILEEGVNMGVGYLLPYYLDNTTGLYTVQTLDTLNVGSASGTYTVPYLPYDFQAKGGIAVKDLGSYAQIQSAYAEYVKNTYLALPDSTYAWLQENVIDAYFGGYELSEMTAEEKMSLVCAIASYIQGAATYDLKHDAALNEEEDIVVAFLGTYKAGICQHFSYAATALYRAMGIPARYTEGFKVESKGGEKTDVLTRDAHAWVEVYLDGVGWIQIEATGSDGAAQNSEKYGELTIQPENITESVFDYPVGTTLAHTGTIVDYENGVALQTLLDNGYTYEATVSGELVSNGSAAECASKIESFKLFDADGTDVTEHYTIHTKEGVLKLTEDLIVSIWMENISCVYDGAAHGYTSDSYWYIVKDESYLPADAEVSFDIGNLSLTGVGKVSKEELIENITVTAGGNDVTENCEFIFNENRLRVVKRDITFQSASASKTYDGEALAADEVVVAFGKLPDGHTFTYTLEGKRVYPGVTQNKIASLQIFDATGADVTAYFDITLKHGKLTVYEE